MTTKQRVMASEEWHLVRMSPMMDKTVGGFAAAAAAAAAGMKAAAEEPVCFNI